MYVRHRKKEPRSERVQEPFTGDETERRTVQRVLCVQRRKAKWERDIRQGLRMNGGGEVAFLFSFGVVFSAVLIPDTELRKAEKAKE
ncbi:hypothetical protein KQX54_011889 [Cotesia glomerata]|uniref:Uncharacterized protein n=1 Tax=Cotesia glomerata TaxID=32391 RepID=A0AAV7ICT2_COTGL|nr:hypothetical protein KQX54_011889 [Cotesia glomerata]